MFGQCVVDQDLQLVRMQGDVEFVLKNGERHLALTAVLRREPNSHQPTEDCDDRLLRFYLHFAVEIMVAWIDHICSRRTW